MIISDPEDFQNKSPTRDRGHMKSQGRSDNSQPVFTPESSLGIYKAENWRDYGGNWTNTRVGYSANVSQLPTVKRS